MWQKLKNLRTSIYIALLLVAGVVGVVNPGTVFAGSATITIACKDNTTDITKTPDNGKNTLTLSCKSGAKIVVTGYNTQRLQPVTLAVTCPGTETPHGVAEGGGNEAPKYIFNCLNVKGSVDSPQTTVAKDTPTAEVSTSPNNPPRCSDGTAASNGDVQNCAIGTVQDPVLSTGNCFDIDKCDFIGKYVNKFINFLAALVGVAVVASIIIGGIEYGSSAGDPAKVTAAKNRIRNAILALLAFLFLYALLNFLIPGGLF